MADEFRSLDVAVDATFADLVASVQFDDVAKGRRGTVIVKPDERGIPIVRTTTAYATAAQRFTAIHDRIGHAIRDVASLAHDFNNALVEHYTRAYAKMKPHSDQALDLADGSSIAVFSCYRDPHAPPSRRLVVTPKRAGTPLEITLAHHTVVVFSLATNRHYTHAITPTPNQPDNDWFGITFRTSATFVRFVDGTARLASGETLTIATDEERRDFVALRRRENHEIDFTYPSIHYTLSPSDLIE